MQEQRYVPEKTPSVTDEVVVERQGLLTVKERQDRGRQAGECVVGVNSCAPPFHDSCARSPGNTFSIPSHSLNPGPNSGAVLDPAMQGGMQFMVMWWQR